MGGMLFRGLSVEDRTCFWRLSCKLVHGTVFHRCLQPFFFSIFLLYSDRPA